MTNEEALYELERNPPAKVFGTEAHCDAYYSAIEALKHQEKYRWHDLRKDPEDLPPEHKRVFAVFDFQIKDYVTAYCFKDFEGTVHWVGLYGLEPIAWKYLEEFEVESE